MIKQIIGILLILIGTVSVGNFISHHVVIPFNDGGSHALIGIILVITGVWLLKSKPLLNGWTNFK